MTLPNLSQKPTSSLPRKARPTLPPENVLKQQAESLSDRTKDFKRLQRQKARVVGGVEARMILASAFVWGEQYISQTQLGIVNEPPEDNKLRLVFNLINQERRKLAGRLIHNGLQFGAQPDNKDPKIGRAHV